MDNLNIDEMMAKIQLINERLTSSKGNNVIDVSTTKKAKRRKRRKKTGMSLVKLAQELQKRTDEVDLNVRKVEFVRRAVVCYVYNIAVFRPSLSCVLVLHSLMSSRLCLVSRLNTYNI